jgi:hypothetical protein
VIDKHGARVSVTPAVVEYLALGDAASAASATYAQMVCWAVARGLVAVAALPEVGALLHAREQAGHPRTWAPSDRTLYGDWDFKPSRDRGVGWDGAVAVPRALSRQATQLATRLGLDVQVLYDVAISYGLMGEPMRAQEGEWLGEHRQEFVKAVGARTLMLQVLAKAVQRHRAPAGPDQITSGTRRQLTAAGR